MHSGCKKKIVVIFREMTVGEYLNGTLLLCRARQAAFALASLAY